MRIFFLLSILVFTSFCSIAQQRGNGNDDFFADDGFFDEDTSDVAVDTLIQGNTFFKLFQGKPGKAALLSLVIPGGGQVYNKRWWKVPFAVGIDVGTISYLVFNQRKYSQFDEIYLDLLNDRIDSYNGVTNPATIKNVRDNYNKFRQYAWIYLIAGHLITVFDAFVDNHLQNFDVSDDLSLEMRGGDGYGTRLSLVVPLHTTKYKKLTTP